MEDIIVAVQQSAMVQNLLANPVLAIVVFIVAFALGKILKLAKKAFKVIILICLAYVIVNFVLSGVV